MAFIHTTTGATDQSSIVRGNVAFVSGTWKSNAEGTATITTGGSLVLGCNVTVGSASTTAGSTEIFQNANKDGNGATTNGSIGLTAMDTTNGLGGDWNAIVQL